MLTFNKSTSTVKAI